MLIWYVAVGGAVGSVSRLLIGLLVQQRAGTTFPVGTLLVNVTGSFLLGFLLGWALETPGVSAEVRAMLTTGFCGGYTTFSTFGYETVVLLEEGRYERAALYVAVSLLGALAATFVGMLAARELLVLRGRP